MRILAISGSTRRASTNTALLRAISDVAADGVSIEVFDRIGNLPVFSPDLEGSATPESVRMFATAIKDSDGLLISSPEYVRSIPGGLKNAIDWLVSGDQVVEKPIAIVHASHRGDDMLTSLRTVLSTISVNFNNEIFFRLPLMKETPEAISKIFDAPTNAQAVQMFLRDFITFCETTKNARTVQGAMRISSDIG